MGEFESKLSTNVSIDKTFPSSVFYIIQCDCGSKECSAHMIVEADRELNLVRVEFYKEIKLCNYIYPYNIFKEILFRIKNAFKIIFTGNITLESDFIISNPKHLDDLITALQESRQYCQKVLEEKQNITKQNIRSCGENLKKHYLEKGYQAHEEALLVAAVDDCVEAICSHK